ncbi:hypothetical protein [Rhizobium ruizarguesonis]|uniref:hypothetical protein n=1 Tax=Rhizobium ruizarguesonis TaxID=2081791 RepID=UPI00102F4940|nr:hypothetical protein [Rhizobium ruizarguesonis]MBC2802786.1 hypothetical protein [Rhizobium ruizarguesonis]TAV04669.1 hypothetical protein ELI39_04970 [Rhizobium ruizarguesonis]TBB21708.1 hypothetical protein ELH51_08215 [Rhizobium ruizarguesonis]TBB74707.1 hypothetical protein ELH43_04535 [Rhizobium ruizarguesonis]TBD79228.1 hypothetical protein ELH11_04615 [Rhizobium ruizarguesonis]
MTEGGRAFRQKRCRRSRRHGRSAVAEVGFALPRQKSILTFDRTGAKLELHSVRYEVFDLPALVGHTAQLSHAGEIMAVAVSAAGAAFQRLAKNRIPGRLATQEQLDELNADMERMADRLADALSALTDASWWLNNENLFTSEDAYELIVGGGEALRRK